MSCVNHFHRKKKKKGKIDEYDYPTGEDILPPDQSRMIEQACFTYSSLGKILKNK